MPMIKIKFDNEKVNTDKIKSLSVGIQSIVREITGINDVFVYADSPEIKIDVAPIEIFVQAGAQVISNKEEMILKIKEKLKNWKKENDFEIPINLTLIPMDWKFEVGI